MARLGETNHALPQMDNLESIARKILSIFSGQAFCAQPKVAEKKRSGPCLRTTRVSGLDTGD